MHIEYLLNAAGSINQKKIDHVRNVLAQSNSGIYCIGKNEETFAISKLFTLAAIIDDYSNESDWKKIALVKSSQVPKDAVIINCSTSISPVRVNQNLYEAGFNKVIPISDLIQLYPERISQPSFVRRQIEEIQKHTESWEKIYERLSDGESRTTFDDVVRFRLTADATYMDGYTVRFDEQYWEDLMGYKEEVFIDAGAFDGDTAQAFAERYPDYKHIHIFEPSPVNISAAKIRLKNISNISFHEMGLSDEAAKLPFNPNMGSASSVSKGCSSTIKVDRLDNIITAPVTAIKMDLEGWEMKALMGAKQQILENTPKLAIAVYHDAADFRLIFDFITSLHNGYKIYLRHYSQGWSETIMYFVP